MLRTTWKTESLTVVDRSNGNRFRVYMKVTSLARARECKIVSL